MLPFSIAHHLFRCTDRDASILLQSLYFPSGVPGYVYLPFPPSRLLRRGSQVALPPLHYLLNRHHGLVIERVHPLC